MSTTKAGIVLHMDSSGVSWAGKPKYTHNSSMDAQNILKSICDMAKTIATAISPQL